MNKITKCILENIPLIIIDFSFHVRIVKLCEIMKGWYY